jgi:hypothetical protein
LRHRLQEDLGRERYYRAGAFGWSISFVPLLQQPARKDKESSLPQMAEAAASVVPKAATARPVARASRVQAADPSYIWIIYDWLRGVYDQSKALVQ